MKLPLQDHVTLFVGLSRESFGTVVMKLHLQDHVALWL